MLCANEQGVRLAPSIHSDSAKFTLIINNPEEGFK
jgi:hypothetical protein